MESRKDLREDPNLAAARDEKGRKQRANGGRSITPGARIRRCLPGFRTQRIMMRVTEPGPRAGPR